MSEQPRGCTGESCKEDGTYVSENGVTRYFGNGEHFAVCPASGKETRWIKVT